MVVDVLGRSVGAPDAIALQDRERTWSYADLEHDVERRAANLAADGHGPASVVACVLDADAAAVITLLAIWKLGATAVPLGASLTEVERSVARRAVEDAVAGTQAVLWTSGTEGRSRGVGLSFEALEASARASVERLGLGREDVWLASLSPAHVGGLALITRSLLVGSRLVAAGPWDARATSDLIDGAGGSGVPPVTHVSLVPTQLLRLLDARGDAPPPATFRCALIGGAGTPTGLLSRALVGGWPIALTYGLTEATSQVATAPPALTREKPGSVGRPLAGVEVSLAEDGELRVRGQTLASGYVAASEPLLDSEGWLHTGDLGRFDEEGDLWVMGRRADRIVSGGVTVDAREVEDALLSHPLVRDAGVVGLHDEEWGERVAAWVEPDPDGSLPPPRDPSGGILDPAELDAYLRDRLGPAKLPRVYHLAPGLPRNANGKLDRAKVKDTLTRLGMSLRPVG